MLLAGEEFYMKAIKMCVTRSVKEKIACFSGVTMCVLAVKSGNRSNPLLLHRKKLNNN